MSKQQPVHTLVGFHTNFTCGDAEPWIEAVFQDRDEAIEVANDLRADLHVPHSVGYKIVTNDVIKRKLNAENATDAILELMGKVDIPSLNDHDRMCVLKDALKAVTK
jgi:hypothetical protein